MRSTLVTAFSSSLMLVCLSGTSSAQTGVLDIAVPSGPAGYSQMPAVPLDSIQAPSAAPLLVFPVGADTSRGSLASDANAAGSGSAAGASPATAGSTSSPIGGVITGLDTVPTFTGAFAGQAGISLGKVFPFIMVGNDPRAGDTTRIPAKIT